MTRIETIHKIRALIAVAEHYRDAIYMTPPGTAIRRRYMERLGAIPYFEWEDGWHKFTACYKVECTGSHIYAHWVYTRDGKKTNLTAIKNSLKRLEKLDQEEKENV